MSDSINTAHDSNNSTKSNSAWVDYYIELLGSLIPGLFSLILSLIAVTLSLLVISRTLDDGAMKPELPSNIDFGIGAYGITGIILVTAYVIGSIFYRQDPKKPDFKSAKRIYEMTKDHSERSRLAVQPKDINAKTITQSDAQFPYAHLGEYLKGRGLNHLLYLIQWKSTGEDNQKRSKMFINQLKIRLQYFLPGKCRDIIKNEAHVRLATSVWFATRWIITVCALGLFCVGLSFIVSTILGRTSIELFFDRYSALTITANLLILFFAWFLKHEIENFIHYLRVREIVYVLETTHIASNENPDLLKGMYE